jgi:hypothetical protein
MLRAMTMVSEPAPPRSDGPTPTERPWRRAWRNALATWGVAYAGYLMINAVFWTATGRAAPPLVEFFNVWNRWDTGHYLEIATNGYNPGTENPAFFPLYPILIRATDPLLPGHKLAAALFVASVAAVAALAVLHRLVEDLFDTPTAQRSTLYLMASPFAFYLVAAYNESLFVALATASLYCMRRGQWWLAGAFAGLASATRYFGVVLALAFAVEYLRQREWRARRIRLDALAVLLVPSGLIGFMIYSARAFGDPVRFATLQEGVWGHTLSPPWTGIQATLRTIQELLADSGTPLQAGVVLNVIDLMTVLIVVWLLVLAVVGPWRLGAQSWYLVAFGAAGFAAATMSPMLTHLPPLHGLPRYALEVVAVFIVLARIGAQRGAERAYLFPAIGLQATLLIAYFANIFLS